MPVNLLSYIYWDVGPELFRIGPLVVRWYGLLFALGFYIGYFVVRWQFRIEKKSEESLNSLFLYMIGGALVGARLGHCFFYQPEYYLQHPWEIFAIWQGGLASHGGAIGILIALYFYARRYPDQPYLWVLDKVVVPTALAGCFIRLGNVFNSELLGTKTDVPWAFLFLQGKEQTEIVPRHPVQLYESFSYLLIFILLLLIYNRLRSRTPRGLIFGLFLVTVFSARFVLEFFKLPQAEYETASGLHVGQWLSIPFVLGGAFLIWRALRGDSSPGSSQNTPAQSPERKAT